MAEVENDSYLIRYAVEQDIPQILQMVQELASYEQALHEVLADQKKLFDTLSFPTSKNAEVRNKPGVAKTLLVISKQASSSNSVVGSSSKEHVAGMALFFNNYSTWLAKPGIYLEDLFVRPEYRGKGFGKALLQALARECVAKDYGRLEWAVLKWNKPSIDFYESEAIGAKSLRDEWEGMRVTGDALVKLAESGKI